MSRISTRTDDDGTPALGDQSRTGKNDPCLKAFADVDEANCAIGVGVAMRKLNEDAERVLLRIKNDLFDLGADLSYPVTDEPQEDHLRTRQEYIEYLETACDQFNAELKPSRSFILPGGTPTSAQPMWHGPWFVARSGPHGLPSTPTKVASARPRPRT